MEEKLIISIKPLIERIFSYVSNDTENIQKIFAFCSNEYDNVYFHPYYLVNNHYADNQSVDKYSRNKYDLSDNAQLNLLDDGVELCKNIFKLFKDYKKDIPTQLILEYDVKEEKFNIKLDYDLHWSHTKYLLPSDIADEWFNSLKNDNNQSS